MSAHKSLLSTLVVLVLAAPASAQLPCANPAADPCLINTPATLPVGLYDIRPKSLVIANKIITINGAGEFKVLANNITLQPGARILAPGEGVNVATVSLDASGAIDLQTQGTSKSKIDVSNSFGGGLINLFAIGNITDNATLIANGTVDIYSYGGEVNLISQTGNISVLGSPDDGIKALGNTDGGGGTIFISANVGSISLATQLAAKGGDCSGCFVDLEAGGNITGTAQANIDMPSAGPGGEGGSLLAFAGGDINLAGNITADGSSSDLEGGDGGSLDIDAGGSVTLSGRINLDGSGKYGVENPADGGGGSGDFAAGTNITLNGVMTALSKGYGSSFDFDFDAFGNVTFNNEIDLSGAVFGANLSVIADGLVTVNGRLHTATQVDPTIDPSVLAGGFDIDACQINITAIGEVSSTGPGGNPSGSNILTASTGLTIAGKLTATDVNELTWRTSPPIITGTVTPPPMIFQNNNLACCGVQCPVTTTSTSTTTSSTSTSSSSSSTSTTSSTSSSSTAVVPTTSTSSAPPTTNGPTTSTSSSPPTTTSTSVIATTTTSTSVGATTSSSSTTEPAATSSTTSSTTILPTTSSTSLPPTTSSTTLATTTSSTSTLIPATTSTTAVATSSSTAPAPTTSTTSAPLTCQDKEVGIGVVRCLLGEMGDAIHGASEDNLGGKRVARAVGRCVDKAKSFAGDPMVSKRLKKAARQLKILTAKLNKALAKHKADAKLVEALTTRASEAQAVITGLVAS